MKAAQAVKPRTTLPAKIDMFTAKIFRTRLLVLGSARASRAGEGALAFMNFSLEREMFRRGRRNGHARARALPR